FCDPEAADIVFKFASLPDGPRVIASGLDITSTADCAVTAASLASICKLNTTAAKIACRILQYPIRTYSYFNLHDVFTLFSLLHPEIFKIDSCGGVSISCASDAFLGRCTITPGSGNILICRSVSTQMFNKMLLDGLS
ncbi:MAG TPA: nucleoside hydrolase, partial [Nitrososphaera sp.]|nr:nucleoside hydrolase [Nitrososphaera sp.]